MDSKSIEQLNDDLNHAEATLGDLVQSCQAWLDDPIRESEDDMVRSIQKWILGRHPSLRGLIEEPEF